MRCDDIAKALREYEATGGTVCVRGFAKPGASEAEVAFAPEGDCEAWTSIPTASIRRAEIVGDGSCKDHRHAVVELELAAPSSAEARAFFDILRGLCGSTAQPSYAMRIGRPPIPIVRPADWWYDPFGAGGGGGGGAPTGEGSSCANRARAKLNQRITWGCRFAKNPTECRTAAYEQYERDLENCEGQW